MRKMKHPVIVVTNEHPGEPEADNIYLAPFSTVMGQRASGCRVAKDVEGGIASLCRVSRSQSQQRTRGLSNCGCCDWIFSLEKLALRKDSRRDAGRSDAIAAAPECELTSAVFEISCDCWFCNGEPDPWE